MSREWKPTENEIKKYLEALVEEMNFRLLMEQRSEQILWVDNIVFISYEQRRKKDSAGIWNQIGECCKRQGKRMTVFVRRLFMVFASKSK